MRIMSSTQEKLIGKLTRLANGDVALVEQALDKHDSLEKAIKYIHAEANKRIENSIELERQAG